MSQVCRTVAVTLVLAAFAAQQSEALCDYDNDCSTTQFCLGSSEDNLATASGQDLITGTLNNESLPYPVPTAIYPAVTSELTLFGKVRQEPGNNAWVIAKGQDSVERDYGLYLRGSANQIWFIFNPQDRTNIVAKSQPWQVVIKQDIAIDDDQWHTVAVTFQPARARVEFYVDGELRAVEVEESLPNYRSSTSNLLYVGGRAGGPEFTLKGSIDVARVYSVALTESQIYDAHREAMLTSARVCTEYQALDQACQFCSSGTDCALRCGSGLTCIGNVNGTAITGAVTPPNATTVTPPLTGLCTGACPCSTAADPMAVCAANGVTYENQCFALCVGQRALYNGTCTPYKTLAVQIGL